MTFLLPPDIKGLNEEEDGQSENEKLKFLKKLLSYYYKQNESFII